MKMARKTYLNLAEDRRDGVDFFGLRYECGKCWLVLDEWAGIDDQAVDALLALRGGALLCRHVGCSLPKAMPWMKVTQCW